MSIITLDIDLTKSIFAAHNVDQTGKPITVKPRVARGQLAKPIAKPPPCLIGMETVVVNKRQTESANGPGITSLGLAWQRVPLIGCGSGNQQMELMR